MIVPTNKPKRKYNNQFDKEHFNRLAKKRYRKEFKKKITTTEINEIIGNWIGEYVVKGITNGDCVRLDKHSTIQVIGTPIMNDKRLVGLLSRGLMVTSKGKLKKADNMDRKRKDFKYSIVYENKLAKNKGLNFKACPNIKKKVREAIINTNTYFKLNVK